MTNLTHTPGMGPDYENAMKFAWKQNLEQAWANPAERREVVDNFAELLGLSPEVLWHWLCTNQLAATQFAKNPTKQTKHQEVAGAWLRVLPLVRDFRILPQAGPDALYVKAGRVLSGEQLVNKATTKSIDFTWEMSLPGGPVLRFYAAHKCTGGSGGSQELQFRDLLEFCHEAAQLQFESRTGTGIRFLALADGDFYDKKRQVSHLPSRLAELQHAVNSSRYAFALSTKTLPMLLHDQLIATVPNLAALDEPTRQALAALRNA